MSHQVIDRDWPHKVLAEAHVNYDYYFYSIQNMYDKLASHVKRCDLGNYQLHHQEKLEKPVYSYDNP